MTIIRTKKIEETIHTMMGFDTLINVEEYINSVGINTKDENDETWFPRQQLIG